MKLVFSRKGFDSASGKAPSPIIGGRPVSLPIPATREIATTYAAIGLGDTVREVTRGRLTGSDGCHHDPMFVAGECIFGQQGAAQSHLARNGVGRGDLFLFFGLFADEASGERHHRFFGYTRVEAVIPVTQMNPADRAELQRLRHPHVMRQQVLNDTIYRGEGLEARSDADCLRLTRPGGPVSRWIVPAWLRGAGLTYHGSDRRWTVPGELAAVARGQEFVSDIGDDPAAIAWAEGIVGAIRA